jgi:glycosyltransferase involved in cell wall biosynthesis
VIATRMGAAAELFDDGKGGFLIPPDDPEALAQAMRSFIERPGLVASCAAHVRHLRQGIPSWPEIGRLTTAAYESAYGHWLPSGSPSNAASAMAAPRPVKPGASGPG